MFVSVLEKSITTNKQIPKLLNVLSNFYCVCVFVYVCVCVCVYRKSHL